VERIIPLNLVDLVSLSTRGITACLRSRSRVKAREERNDLVDGFSLEWNLIYTSTEAKEVSGAFHVIYGHAINHCSLRCDPSKDRREISVLSLSSIKSGGWMDGSSPFDLVKGILPPFSHRSTFRASIIC
jgi:hypothetical protein